MFSSIHAQKVLLALSNEEQEAVIKLQEQQLLKFPNARGFTHLVLDDLILTVRRMKEEPENNNIRKS